MSAEPMGRAIFYGDKLLSTDCPEAGADRQLLEKLGLERRGAVPQPQVLPEKTKIGHSQMINPTKGEIMTTNTNPDDENLSEQIEHAIETVLDLGSPPHEQDSETGEPFTPESVPDEGVPAVSEAELEQQALAHPGADGDASTPE